MESLTQKDFWIVVMFLIRLHIVEDDDGHKRLPFGYRDSSFLGKNFVTRRLGNLLFLVGDGWEFSASFKSNSTTTLNIDFIYKDNAIHFSGDRAEFDSDFLMMKMLDLDNSFGNFTEEDFKEQYG